MKITKAMILCAGFGKRLRPLTFSSPKPLLKIGDQTLLSNTLHMLEQHGVKKAVINIHYLGNHIIDYINKNKFSMAITIVNEKDKILDTGGGILNAIEHFSNEPFIVINPDTIWNSNYLNELKIMEKEFSMNKKNKCSLLVVNKNKSFDQALNGDFNLENKLVTRKDTDELKYIYTGFQIVKPDIFDHSNLKIFSINKIWDELIQDKVLTGKESNINFLHVSTKNIYKSLLETHFKH
ncbi:MAG: nucleotidyltransferase family protein [Pelagibacteraceae bacterium]|jgi:MurNAc alpha-1-phosphate uridylyltransferase|nr:nucleotidyltransferase [Candidatus Pelagibacter sp.]MDP6680323.1 nucleotidyltransferase family protein [Pelagibacteraceae bacterium]MDP6710598.1 nucleotidyltransferase family protein [Pelagibacteraceae bacterium]|tara:strand:- start:2180 stop:2890 length:711 start_codon:yes stop_codon:yes gene_type:complete